MGRVFRLSQPGRNRKLNCDRTGEAKDQDRIAIGFAQKEEQREDDRIGRAEGGKDGSGVRHAGIAAHPRGDDNCCDCRAHRQGDRQLSDLLRLYRLGQRQAVDHQRKGNAEDQRNQYLHRAVTENRRARRRVRVIDHGRIMH